MLWPVVFAFSVACCVSSVLTYFVKHLARRLDLVSLVRHDRWNSRPIPLLGGLVVLMGALSSFLFQGHFVWLVFVVFMAGTLAFFIGLADDKIRFKPHIKLIYQILLSLTVVFIGFSYSGKDLTLFQSVLTLFWLVAISNAFNLLDNIDGLATGVAAIAAFFQLLLFMDSGNLPLAVLTAGFLGGLLGFLVHNFSPASIFLGDAGSLFIGFMLGTLSLAGSGGHFGSALGPLIVPCLILMVPVFDMTFVTLIRAFSGRSPFQGGLDHMSHRLVVAGLSEKKAVLIFCLFSCVSGTLAIAFKQNLSHILFWGVLLVIGMIFIGIYLAQIQVYPEPEGGLAPEGSFVVNRFIPFKRQLISVVLDMLFIVAAYFLAYALRFENDLSVHYGVFAISVPWVVFSKIIGLSLCGIYKATWRYTSISDILTILKGVLLGSVISIIGLLFIWRFSIFSRAVFAIDFILLVGFITTSRLVFRLLDYAMIGGKSVNKNGGKRVLIYGAGDMGEATIRGIARNYPDRFIAGFIDDHSNKRGSSIHGIEVLGTSRDLPRIIHKFSINELILSSGKINGNKLESAKMACTKHGVEVLRPHWVLEQLS